MSRWYDAVPSSRAGDRAMTPEEMSRYGYVWIGRDTPTQLKPIERRIQLDPYCPHWCPYQCTGTWKAGHCLIRIPEATKMLMETDTEMTIS